MASGNQRTNYSEATVEIKIKTLDSQTYTLRVDKCVPVPELKERIATVTGVLSEQQRLICRGRVLKDDQLLSAYHVEDGHTLHLVVRQPIPPSSDSLPNIDPETDHLSNAFHSQGIGGEPSVLVGAFNISENGDGAFPAFNQILSAFLNSIGVGSGSQVVTPWEPSNSGLGDFSGQQQHQATLQPPVVPDSLATLSQYLSQLRDEFGTSGGSRNNSHIAATHGINLQTADSALPSTAGQRGLSRPASLAEVLLSTRQLLIEQVADCLSHLAQQLEGQANVTDPTVRMSFQTNCLRYGALLQNLGALILELGRTTMTLRVGQTPADAMVNAGPPVFISTFGPNPMMVQPFPFQSGTSLGTTPVGTAEVTRNINVRIRTGSFMPNERDSNILQPSTRETNPAVSGVADSVSQATAASLGNPPSIRVSEVRVMPIRTVVTAIPASVRQTFSDSSHSSMGLFHPVLDGAQNVNSEILDNTSNSQLSSDQNPCVPSNASGNGDFQTLATISTTHEAAANSQEATPTVGSEGAFFSNVLRQMMPFITQNVALGSEVASSGRDAPNTEASTQGES
ncbi:ubiquitin-like domain-containing protein CIP73 isoform X2 [Manihot esculenta]|uniref:ubiquitin-like domain-containing protein CIP73 isoform X2 n=1 Tax=Manihot esculenta TaxID=3983 RepID=UPI001CC3B1BC|nr:ubiquitin-like domain-containing protein CIP73 isoform X2 [Manihot esculenta]